MSNLKIRFGVDNCLKQLPEVCLRGNWGMVTNDAARLAEFPEHKSRKALLDAGIPLTRLFAPEHGIDAGGTDGSAIEDSIDPVTDLPVCSLYGTRLKPPQEILEELDGLIVDLPCVGTRFYTYLWALSYVLESCSETGTPLMILDRINPLSGQLDRCEGPILDTSNGSSYLGRAPMPIRHGLTLGEFSRWLISEWKLETELEVMPVTGWHRDQSWGDTGLPFIPPSPAIVDFQSALCYPGTCFFEATNLSTGRGTDRPFQHIGAPWLDPVKVHSVMASFNLPGITWQETTFTPNEEPYKEEVCHGLSLHVTDHNTFRPVETGLTLLAVIHKLYSSKFDWQPYPTAANPTGRHHFELLLGRYHQRELLEDDPEKFIEELPRLLSVPDWGVNVGPFLLYD